MMHRYLSVDEMISIEKASDLAGHTYPKMMAFAGKSLAEEIIKAFADIEASTALGLVGSGNNGGDTLIALKILLDLGWDCSAYLTSDRKEDLLTSDFIHAGGQIYQLSEDADLQQLRWLVLENEILLDGLLGTGIRLPLREPVSEVLKVVGESLDQAEIKPKIVAVDCPSGVDCDSGNASELCLAADLTVCMAAVKQGMLKLPAYSCLGKLVVGNIGLHDDLPELTKITRFVLDEEFAFQVLPARPLDGHKGTFGTVLIVAGSKNFPGAALLAGKSAFRIGAGWVNIAVLDELQPYLVTGFPEATWLSLPGDETGLSAKSASRLHRSISKETAMLVGPGLGVESGAQEFMVELLSQELLPLIVDADGLKLLSGIDDWWKKIPTESILTPHPGEMSIMTSLSVAEIQESRVDIAEHFANKWGHVVVLKGAFTVIAEPGGKTAILPVASPALARAGTGDVLAGMISGLRAQRVSAFDSAAAGVWLHAAAGLAAAESLGSTAGVLAGDLIDQLPGLLPY